MQFLYQIRVRVKENWFAKNFQVGRMSICFGSSSSEAIHEEAVANYKNKQQQHKIQLSINGPKRVSYQVG